MRWLCAGCTCSDAKVNLYVMPDDIRGSNVEDQRGASVLLLGILKPGVDEEISYFWQDVRHLAVGSVSAVVRRQFADPDLRLVIWIALAMAPIMLAGALLSNSLNTCNSLLRALPMTGWACIVMAVLMTPTEILARHRRSVRAFRCAARRARAGRSPHSRRFAFRIDPDRGACARIQARRSGAVFIFIGHAAIALAGSKGLGELHKANLDMHGWFVLELNLVVASVSAIAAIWALMHVLERFSAWPFVIYRGMLGVFSCAMDLFLQLRGPRTR